MNTIYRSIWNNKTGTLVAVSENAKAAGKSSSNGSTVARAKLLLCISAVSLAVMLAFGTNAHAQPVGGVVVEGIADIQQSTGLTTINQSTQNTVINWQSFNILQGQTVQFVQPNTSSVALNRIVGSDASSIFGTLSANGQVFLVNPNGILFAPGASVNVGGLVASTLNISDSDFMAGNYRFSGTSNAAVDNQGNISANGGYVALLGANVSNQGVIQANMGTIVLAAGDEVTLDVAGDGLLSVTVDKGAVNALIENGGLIRANGGKVFLTASVAGNLLQTVVNNTGVIEAQTLNNVSGVIQLLADMQSGMVNVGGTLDASAPNGGDGGFIEASAAYVKIQPEAQITTAAPTGITGMFLIDPEDFIIGGNASDNISGATLSALLVTNSVTITTAVGTDSTVPGTPPESNLFTTTPGNGDIFVNEAVSWTASSSPTTLSLNADRDVNVNAAVTAVNGNFEVCCGRDVNLNAAVTTTNGSMLLNAGRNINMNAAVTTTDGNITMCAAENITIAEQITLTRGTSIPAQSLGLPLGLVLNAGYGGTGPGTAGGTLIFAPLSPDAVVTGPNAPVTILYNPVSYATPTDYSGNFVLTGGATLTQRMLVFADGGDKTFDGSTATTLTGLKDSPAGVTLVAGPGSTANFDTADVGVNKKVTYSGYTLGGADANNFALAENCCGPVFANTTANISAAPVVVVPPIVVVPPAPVAAAPETIVPPILTPVVALPFTAPPQVALTVIPDQMPTVSVVEDMPVLPVEEVIPVEEPYVAPVFVPKQDRG